MGIITKTLQGHTNLDLIRLFPKLSKYLMDSFRLYLFLISKILALINIANKICTKLFKSFSMPQRVDLNTNLRLKLQTFIIIDCTQNTKIFVSNVRTIFLSVESLDKTKFCSQFFFIRLSELPPVITSAETRKKKLGSNFLRQVQTVSPKGPKRFLGFC